MSSITDKNTMAKHKPGERVRYGWQSELSQLIKEHNIRSSDGSRNVGTLTRQARIHILYLGFKQLRGELNFKIENPRNFSEKHMHALVALWEKQELSASTIQNRISMFRVFSEWIGKNNMIKKSEEYCSSPEVVRRSQVNRVDKSWSFNGVDVETTLLKIEAYSKHAAAQLLMIRAFGLRRMEAISFKPNMHWEQWTGSEFSFIRVRDGTKGGRERVLAVKTPEQEHALLYAMQVAGRQKRASIGFPDMKLQQSVRKYNYIMEKFGLTKVKTGVTGHGLRHQYANDRYEQLTGMQSPVRGGGTMSEKDKEADIDARYQVSEELGHSRLSVTAAYYGNNRNITNRSNG
ncbi:MAG: integrase domain-containing protein [Methylophilaceae bacterium]|nr:integrase domain-containing protein [Methylophilaceae bacterium]